MRACVCLCVCLQTPPPPSRVSFLLRNACKSAFKQADEIRSDELLTRSCDRGSRTLGAGGSPPSDEDPQGPRRRKGGGLFTKCLPHLRPQRCEGGGSGGGA